MGSSMPINDFGSKDKSATSGFAIPGFKLDMGFNIQLYKHLGIKSQLMWQNNQLDETKYKKDLLAENTANTYTISSGGWNNYGIFIGVFGNFNLSSNAHLQPYLLGGFNFGTSPLIKINAIDSLGSNFIITQYSKLAMNFSYAGGLDLKLDIDDSFQFITGVSAFYCELKFNNIRVDNTSNSVNKFNILQPVQTLGFKIGIAKILK